jgi:hypothetical protein
MNLPLIHHFMLSDSPWWIQLNSFSDLDKLVGDTLFGLIAPLMCANG